MIFYFGIKGFFGVFFFIWVELNRLVVIVCLRIVLVFNLFFIKILSFILMGLFKVEVSCVFLIEKGVNIFNLFFIFNFVNWVIVIVVNMYVVFKLMILDIGKMF